MMCNSYSHYLYHDLTKTPPLWNLFPGCFRIYRSVLITDVKKVVMQFYSLWFTHCLDNIFIWKSWIGVFLNFSKKIKQSSPRLDEMKTKWFLSVNDWLQLLSWGLLCSKLRIGFRKTHKNQIFQRLRSPSYSDVIVGMCLDIKFSSLRKLLKCREKAIQLVFSNTECQKNTPVFFSNERAVYP